MPNGAPANLASGGMPPVATASGKLPALDSARPVSSTSPAGSVSCSRAFSGSGAANCTSLTAPLPSSTNFFGANGAPAAGTSRACCASARGTGAVKRSVIGRNGRQADCAFSRSQLNSTAKRSRTFHSKRCVSLDPVAGPHTSRTPAIAGNGRWQASNSRFAAGQRDHSRARARSSASRGAPSISFTPMRSPSPSTSHQARRVAPAASAGPLKRSRKCWSSSMRAPS